MTRSAWLPAAGFMLLLVCSASTARAEQPSPYVNILQAEATFNTIRSYAMVPLALPAERAKLQPQLLETWWANNPELEMNEHQREIAGSELINQLDIIERLATTHALRRIEFLGFTPIGSNRDMELYYKARTNVGPVIYRFSVAFREEGRPLLFGIKVFEGFDAAREALRDVRHVAGERVASFTYNPEEPDAE